MVIGVMEVGLALYDNTSLKAKRSVVRRILARSRNTFNVSGAEIEDQDALDRAVLGFAAVGNDARYIEGLLSKLEGFIERLELAEVLDATKEVEHF